MIDTPFPCPIPGCPHSTSGTKSPFRTRPTLLRHLNHTSHQTSFHLADQSICSKIGIFTCCYTSCPTAPKQFFHSHNELLLHNSIHHPPPSTSTHTFHTSTDDSSISTEYTTPETDDSSTSTEETTTNPDDNTNHTTHIPNEIPTGEPTTQRNSHNNIPPPIHPVNNPQQSTATYTPLTISTSILFPNAHPGSHNSWQHGLNFITNSYDHQPPDFRSTWRQHLNRNQRNKITFTKLQAAIIRAISTAYTNCPTNDNTAPFWWLLFHLDMLILAPTTTEQRERESINNTIKERINAIYSGNIQHLFETSMSCTRLSQSSTPAFQGHNRTAQKAADADQYRTAVARACTPSSVALIDSSNIHIVNKLYTTPVPTKNNPPPPPPTQQYAHPGDICDTITHANRHKGAGVNADSIDLFIDLVKSNIPSIPVDLNHIFNQIYQNNLPPTIHRYFTDVYLFCLHKDPNDTTKLRPLGIPTAIRRLIASHVAHTFRGKFARHLLPFNWAVGAPNGNDFIVKAMQLKIEKYISTPKSTGNLPTRAAVFFDLTNQFNSISREAFLDVITKSFPEILPLATLFYSEPGTVHHKWADGTWRTLVMEEGVSQGCPLSPIFASLVVACLLRPLDKLLKERAKQRLQNGNPGDDGSGGITHLLGFVDDVSTCTPLEDIEFLCQNFDRLGRPLGCFINPMKTRILTSTSGSSPLPTLSELEPTIATSITRCIATYSTKPNNIDPTGPPLPEELTTGFRLLGSPVGSPSFAREYFNQQLTIVQECIETMTIAITDPQTRLRLFSQCLIQKLPHLLGCDVLYHQDHTDTNPLWTNWAGPLTTATDSIISRLLADLIRITTLPHYSLLIAQLSVSLGGLGLLCPRSRAAPDFLITFTTAIRHATTGINLSRHLEPFKLHPTISDLFSLPHNPDSLILKRYHCLLPHIAQAACPPTTPRTDLADYFLTTLSPHSARGRIKKHSMINIKNELLNHVYESHFEHFHHLPSILSPQSSYPLIAMSRSNPSHRLSPITFYIMLRRKLRLPVYPKTIPCSCTKHDHDIYGDHAFSCGKNSKKRAHNIIVKGFAETLSTTLAAACYILPNTRLDIETPLHLQSDPTARPFDFSFNPDSSASNFCHYTTIGADINITNTPTPPTYSTSEDHLTLITANADSNLQAHERRKLRRPNKPASATTPLIKGDDIIGDLIRNKMVLIPFTIDPWCRFGPMLQAFLTTTQHPPQNTFRSDRPNASTMLKWATTPPCPLGILTSADHNWKLSQSPTRRPFFGHSHTTPTPSILHRIQQLGP